MVAEKDGVISELQARVWELEATRQDGGSAATAAATTETGSGGWWGKGR